MTAETLDESGSAAMNAAKEEVLLANVRNYGGDPLLILKTTTCGNLIESVQYYSFDPDDSTLCNLIIFTTGPENAATVASTLDEKFIWGSLVRAYYPRSSYPGAHTQVKEVEKIQVPLFKQEPSDDEWLTGDLNDYQIIIKHETSDDEGLTGNSNDAHTIIQQDTTIPVSQRENETDKGLEELEDGEIDSNDNDNNEMTSFDTDTDNKLDCATFSQVSPVVSSEVPTPLMEITVKYEDCDVNSSPPEVTEATRNNTETDKELPKANPLPSILPASCLFCYNPGHTTYNCKEIGEYIRISKSLERTPNKSWPEVSLVKVYGLHAGPTIEYFEKSHLHGETLSREQMRIIFAFIATDAVCLRCGTSGHLCTPLRHGAVGLCHHVYFYEDIRNNSFTERQRFCRQIQIAMRRLHRGITQIQEEVWSCNRQFRRLERIKDPLLMKQLPYDDDDSNLIVTIDTNQNSNGHQMARPGLQKRQVQRKRSNPSGKGHPRPLLQAGNVYGRPPIKRRKGTMGAKSHTIHTTRTTGIGYWSNQ